MLPCKHADLEASSVIRNDKVTVENVVVAQAEEKAKNSYLGALRLLNTVNDLKGL